MGKPVKNEENYKFEINNLNLHYGDFHALKNINMNIEKIRLLHLSVLQAVENRHF